MQATFLIHEGFIVNLPSQTGLVCICGKDRHEKNKTLLSDERLKKNWNKLSPLRLPQRIPQVLVAADAIWCSYQVLESHCSQSTLTWRLETLFLKAIQTLRSSWLFLICRAAPKTRLVINFSPLTRKILKSQPQIKAFPGKQQNVSYEHSSRDTRQVLQMGWLNSSRAVWSLCWGIRLLPRFWGTRCMQNTLVRAHLLANWLQLLKLCWEAQEQSVHTPACKTATPGIKPARSGAPAQGHARAQWHAQACWL